MSEVKVKTIMMGHEKGLLSSFMSSFPSGALARCDFHWKSNLRLFTI
jgi:hypothetical protein